MAVGQPSNEWLAHCYREQTPSHISFVLRLR